MDRLLLLLPTRTYRTEAFVEAAGKLGVDLVCASERPSTLEDLAPDSLITLDFADPDGAARRVADFARSHPLAAVVGVDDQTTVAAAAIAGRLRLRSSPLTAVSAARNKHEMRQRLQAAGVPVPSFMLVQLADDPAGAALRTPYPVVLKPLALSASRGVIRADSPAEFVTAFHRIGQMLRREDVSVPPWAAGALLVEAFVPGAEVALEGLLVEGELHTLALFDKPDPLDGPFFEETIYVTPSRLPGEVQTRIERVTRQACAALGLTDGPIHAELRVPEPDGEPRVIEVAARSIGGLCSRTLRFGTGMGLEELILRHALGWQLETLDRERQPAGVMMIPIPRAGRLLGVEGREQALAVAGIEDVTISAHIGQELTPLPEGWQYLGFIFARAGTPQEVEAALRAAHGRLRFDIA